MFSLFFFSSRRRHTRCALVTGVQTCALPIFALGQIGMHNWRPLLRKELAVAAVNGALWAMVVGTIAWLWFNSPLLALVVGMAMIINQTVAALAGVFVPLTLKKFGEIGRAACRERVCPYV